MVLWLELLAAKPDDLILVSRTHMVEKKTNSWNLHACCGTHTLTMRTHTHTHTEAHTQTHMHTQQQQFQEL